MGWSAVMLVAAVASSREQGRLAESASHERHRAVEQQREAQRKQEAREQSQLAVSRRQQVRQERVRRAQILQRSQNLGVAGGSGALGSMGALGTLTGSTMGQQFFQGQAASSITGNLQTASDFETSAMNLDMKSKEMQGYSQMASSMFMQSGGIGKTVSGVKGLFS